MSKNRFNASCFLFSFLISSSSLAQLEGEWMLSVNHGVERLGVITFEENNGEIKAFVDGGPVDLTLDTNQIEMTVDYRNGGGRYLSRRFTGTIAGDSMSGTLVATHDDSTGTWVATRRNTNRESEARPINISGIWSRISAGM